MPQRVQALIWQTNEMGIKKTSIQTIAAATNSPRPTLKTIAEITNLGTTTVSRALKDAPEIGEKTKARVKLVAEQLGYTPNRAGVGLRTGRTNVINLVLSLDDEIMAITSLLVRGLSEALSTTPYHLVVTPYALHNSPLDRIRYIVETRSADGIILSRIEPNDSRVEYLVKHKIPFATHGRTEMGIEHPYHDFDNYRYVYEGVKHLYEKSRSHIALLAPPDTLTFFHHAMAGYQRGLSDCGLKPYRKLRFCIGDTLDTIENLSEKLFRSKNRPDAIISMSGGSTIALCSGIENAGLTVGKEVDIISKQTVNILPRFRSEIATVHEDIRLAGNELARQVVSSIENTPNNKMQSVVYPE